MKFTYRSKGTTDEWATDVVEADTKEDAIKKLDKIYDVQRDKNGKQTNADVIKVEIIKSS